MRPNGGAAHHTLVCDHRYGPAINYASDPVAQPVVRHEISADQRRLTLLVSARNQGAIRDLLQDNGGVASAALECEVLEHLLTNSDLTWVSAEDTGDLTDAPLLGILGKLSSERDGPFGSSPAGTDGKGTPMYHDIDLRWGYPHYQIRSFVMDLAASGSTTFVDSW